MTTMETLISPSLERSFCHALVACVPFHATGVLR
jgi:hypothetical protein